jgi:hypothetical protein
MKTFSCRFEFTHDYTQFITAASKNDVIVGTSELYHVRIEEKGHPLPDIHVEFMCDATTESLRDIMRTVDDLHVGIQTLLPVSLKNNPLERDYSIV